jgi:hypothetical protein
MPMKPASLICMLVAGFALAPLALADDPIKDVIDNEVPALKDGTRIHVGDVQVAILDACRKRRFECKVESDGVIVGVWSHHGHEFTVSIPYTNEKYSVRYKDSKHMDYNAARQRIDDSYNEYVASLNEYIEAYLEHALKRLKAAQKRAKKAGG